MGAKRLGYGGLGLKIETKQRLGGKRLEAKRLVTSRT